jgi:ribosomal protein L37AE/L43A
MRKDMWDLDVTGMKSKHVFHVATFDTIDARLMGKVKQHLLTDRPCIVCDSLYPKDRAALGYSTCMRCGEVLAKQRKHTVAPMHKSNYMLITNLADLRGINNKGGSFR